MHLMYYRLVSAHVMGVFCVYPSMSVCFYMRVSSVLNSVERKMLQLSRIVYV